VLSFLLLRNEQCLFFFQGFGNTFAEIGAREPQPRASETFTQFANYHRQLEKHGITMLRNLKPVCNFNQNKSLIEFLIELHYVVPVADFV